MIRFLKSKNGMVSLTVLGVGMLVGLWFMGFFSFAEEKLTPTEPSQEIVSFIETLSATRQQSFTRLTNSDQAKATADFVQSWNAIASSPYWSSLKDMAANARPGGRTFILRRMMQTYYDISRNLPETMPEDKDVNYLLSEFEEYVDGGRKYQQISDTLPAIVLGVALIVANILLFSYSCLNYLDRNPPDQFEAG